MDVTIAILQLKAGREKSLREFNPSDFDILLRESPNSNGGGFIPDTAHPLHPPTPNTDPLTPNPAQEKVSRELPRTRMGYEQEASEVALELAKKIAPPGSNRNKWRRAVKVGLWKNEHSSHSFPALFCIPTLEKEKGTITQRSNRLKFFPLEQALELSWNSSPLLDAETRHLLTRLQEWIRESEKVQARFLRTLFLRSSSALRLKYCAHNPAYLNEIQACGRVRRELRPNEGSVGGGGSELGSEVRRANEALAQMMAMEKCDVFIINALFGSGLPYKGGRAAESVSYFARGRPEPPPLHLRSPSNFSGSESSAESAVYREEFPLHYAANIGDEEKLRVLLNQGHDPNQPDSDSWTPLHYAAWYGQLSSVKSLINFGGCDVNTANRMGSTPLHFAAWCGHHYVVELLLTHPQIIVSVKDKNGKSPVDLCECNPKPEWQASARLLTAASTQKLPKIKVDMMDGSNVMLSLLHGAETTVGDLFQQLVDELNLTEACAKLFAIWICSESLELQLRADHKPAQQLSKWKTKILPKWSDSPSPDSEEPRLVMRRDARVSIVDEKKTKLTDSALGLLFHEAHSNYIRGLYPCSDQDMVMLAALMVQITYGNYDSKKDKLHLSNQRNLQRLLPHHKLKGKGVGGLIQKIIGEHKQVSSKGAKSISGLQLSFLSFCRNLRVYGSAFFNATVFMVKPHKGGLEVHVGVNDCGLHLVSQETKLLFQSFPIQNLIINYQPSKPFIEFQSKSGSPIYIFTLTTRQASHVNMLLKKLVDPNGSQNSSRLNLSDVSSRS